MASMDNEHSHGLPGCCGMNWTEADKCADPKGWAEHVGKTETAVGRPAKTDDGAKQMPVLAPIAPKGTKPMNEKGIIYETRQIACNPL